jgi:hypothetical protein
MFQWCGVETAAGRQASHRLEVEAFMCHWRLGTALFILGGLLCYGHPSSGFDGKFKLPCMIFYNEKPAFVVTCEVRINVTERHFLELARTPNGRTFVIENGKVDASKWYLDHEAAVETSGEPLPCYRNARVQVCL